MTTRKTQTVTQHDGKIITFFTSNSCWVKAYAEGKSSWETSNLKYAKLLVGKTPDIILDIGANIGQEAIYYADWANHVHSFEPVPEIFEMLCANVMQNNLTNVKLYQVGVSDCEGTALIDFLKGNEGRSHIVETQSERTHKISLVRIDDLEFDGKIDFIKMDVEGFEFNALNGMKNLIEAHSPVCQIESHEANLIRQNVTSEDIWDFFNSRGYESTIATGRKIERHNCLRKDRSRCDLFFKKIS